VESKQSSDVIVETPTPGREGKMEENFENKRGEKMYQYPLVGAIASIAFFLLGYKTGCISEKGGSLLHRFMRSVIVSLSVLFSYFCVNKFWFCVYVNVNKCKCY